MWESFHGASLDAISVGGEYVFSKDMGPLLPGCIKAIPYNAYRNLIHSSNPETVAAFCLDYLEYVLRQEGDVGAILRGTYPCHGYSCAACVFLPRLKKNYAIKRKVADF